MCLTHTHLSEILAYDLAGGVIGEICGEAHAVGMLLQVLFFHRCQQRLKRI